ncbi:MAG: 16S rRNA (cytidine(1402)-2'-O)-methyltransferase [Patescibacteria group bacterium]|nr:16S rRNA (cytidine(1402)-2'-O)-methyltransferase [Patescibacteria group bacterium]
MNGTLYVIATPIGNLEDITLRALRILKEVDYILCEDTRVTKKLLDRYEIETKSMSYNVHSSKSKENSIVELLKNSQNLALVSDAGTPCISDPGVLLISRLKEEGIEVVPIPGPSALISALSASGIPSSEFTFLGFLPHKKGREKLFKEIAKSKRTMVFYESPHRLMKTLNSLKEHTDKDIVVAKEISKQFEEFISGKADEIIAYLEDNQKKQKGEFVIIIK